MEQKKTKTSTLFSITTQKFMTSSIGLVTRRD